MKKRIFGMLLMGAMVVASMSMFTSCKDYDDDINANKAEIASLKTALQEQKTSLEAAIAAAKSEASTANATLNTKLTELTTLVGNNKTELENSIKAAVTDSKAYADGVSADALKAAQAYADAAAKEAAAAAKAEGLEEAKKALDELAALVAAGDEANAKAIAEKADELVAKISAVDDKLVKLIDAEKEERINALAAVNTQIENINLQIAALEKFKTEISKKVSDIAKDLDNTKAILESVKKAAEKNAEDIKKNKEDIAAINTALKVIDGKIVGLEEQVELLKKADVDLKALISANTAEIAAVKDAYQKADAALKQEFEDLLKKDYYTKAEIDEILKGYAKTTIDGYTVPADVEKYVSEVKADMENQITETLNAYDQKLAAALVALFGADDAEGAAAADVTMSDEAIEALKALKENYTNGINKQVEEQLNVLKSEKGKQLTSLVFIPDLYLDGIEAVEVLAVKDTILALVDEKKKGDVAELWGVKGDKYVAVPDSALTTWYIEPYAENPNGPAYIKWGWTVNGQHVVGNGADVTNFFGNNDKVNFYEYYPLATANYHLNPTSANIEGAELSFYENVAKVEPFLRNTRAGNPLATPATSVVTKEFIAENVNDGILTVPFSVDREKLNSIRYATVNNNPRYTGNEAFIALQANIATETGDTTVTSDYALLTPSDIDIVALGGKWMCGANEPHYIGYDHLATKLIVKNESANKKSTPVTSGFVLYEAGKNSANKPYYSPIDDYKNAQFDFTLKVPYDKSINLNEQVFTHIRRGYINRYGQFVPAAGEGDWSCDEEWDVDQIKALGLHYEFEAIHYNSGANMTDEFVHIKLEGDNGEIATPTTVDDKGKQILDQPAGREIIGRMPIVRATLVNDDHEVLAVGYILIEITSPNIAPEDIVIELPEAWMNCTAPAAITWSQVEDQILKQIQLSKTEFEALYELETAPIAQNATTSSAAFFKWYTAGPTTVGGHLEGRFYSKAVYNGWGDFIPWGANQENKSYPAVGYVNRTAVQYVKVNGQWKNIYDLNKNLLKAGGAVSKVYTNASIPAWAKDQTAWNLLYRPLGSVYERVDDEGQQTTVLEWNVGSEVTNNVANTADFVSNIYGRIGAAAAASANQRMRTSINEALIASGASVESEGHSTKDVEVTVAFKQKDQNRQYISTNAIYVTLRIPAGKLHFAYAKVAGKDLSLWYQKNSWLNADGAEDADEIHLNVPTPGKAGYTKPLESVLYGWPWLDNKPKAEGEEPLHGDLFYKQLSTTFRQGLVTLDGLNTSKFSKFKTSEFFYRLVDPETAGAEHITVGALQLSGKGTTKAPEQPVQKSWIVNGVSGAQYLLYVSNDEDIDGIFAAAWINPTNGRAEDLNLPIVRLKYNGAVTGVVPERRSSIVYENNFAAQDILNYAGRLNKSGDVTKNDLQMVDGEYLTRENKTFTAFIQIQPVSPCYDLLMPNSFFRARWLRPINVVDGDKTWIDANNEVQVVTAAELVKVYDWRTYAVGADATDKQTKVHAPYYEINDSTHRHFYIDFEGIRTDHDLGAASAERKLDPNQEIEIEQLTLAKDLPSLQEGNGFFKCVYNETTKKLELQYKNGGANVGVFHFYVPVYVSYAFGDYWMKTGTAADSNIGAIHKPSRAARTATNYPNEPAENEARHVNPTDISATDWDVIKTQGWKPIFTQKVYAVITVDQTHQSHTGE